MALQAKQIDIATSQQPGIGRTVWRVASHASFCLNRRMLKRKRTSFVCVAIKAKLVLSSRGAQLMCQEPAMRIVAVAACYQAFIHFVMERF